MKRLMHILLSVTLSVMILLMGSGTIVVHCNHSGTTRVISYNNDTCGRKCKPTASCMTSTVIKLSTVTQVQQPTFDHTLPVVFLPWLNQPVYLPTKLFFPPSDVQLRAENNKHGPPRQYLNIICQLLC